MSGQTVTDKKVITATMKILALVSSHRKRGNTARIVQMIEAHMSRLAATRDAPLDFETLYLGDMDVRFCQGCRACFDRGEDRCPLKDDVPLIKAKMDAADGLILASPVYVDDVSGIAKTLLESVGLPVPPSGVCRQVRLSGRHGGRRRAGQGTVVRRG